MQYLSTEFGARALSTVAALASLAVTLVHCYKISSFFE